MPILQPAKKSVTPRQRILSLHKALPLRKQHEISEIITGNIIKHTLYISNTKDPVAKIEDLDNTPIFFGIKDIGSQVFNYLKEDTYKTNPTLSITINSVFVPQGMNVNIPLSKLTRSLFENIKDYSKPKSFKEIFEEMIKKTKATQEECIEEAHKVLNLFIDAGIMVFRDKKL